MIVEREIIVPGENRKTANPRMLCRYFRRLSKFEATVTTLVAGISIATSSISDDIEVSHLLSCLDRSDCRLTRGL
jgi:hypothetical protein